MNADQRPASAAIAVAFVSGSSVSYVYDHSTGATFNITASIKGGKVSAYDHSRLTEVSGRLPGSLFDNGAQAYVNYRFDGRSVAGFDYATDQHFRIDVDGQVAQFFDYDGSGSTQFTAG